MNVLKKIFYRTKTAEKVVTVEKMIPVPDDMGYIEEAQTAVNIVNTEVEKRDFSQLTTKLDQLPTTGISREKYVFDRQSSVIYGWIIFSCIVFAIGYLYFIPISLGTMLFSNKFEIQAWIGLIGTVAVLAVNIVTILRIISKSKFNKRYDTYLNVLRFRNIELIDDLAAYAKQDSIQVVRDLNNAIKFKLIPQGHFGRDNIFFMVSDEIYRLYKEKQAVYDRYYRKLVEERVRMNERTKEMQDILERGQGYVDKIRESNDIIKDKIISEKLERMEKAVSMIFYEVDINPTQADKLGMFMNYYLPTTEKLLEAYIEIDEKQIKGKTLDRAKKDIEGAIDKLIDSFEGLLDKFYQEQELDLSTDISAMEIIMKQEGLIE